jgi:4-alpha-glucanotransferase
MYLALRGALSALCRSPAEVVLINLEDLWLEPKPQNVPGTRREYPNWRRRLARSIEALTSEEELCDFLRTLRDLRPRPQPTRAVASARA